MKKRRHVGRILLLILLGLLTLGGALLRTEWAGEKVCAAARRRLPELLGMDVSIGHCAVDPLRGGVELRGFSVTPKSADEPLFAAERLLVRLRGFELLAGNVRLERVEAERPRINVDLRGLALDRKREGCPLDDERIKLVEVDTLAVSGAEVRVLADGGRSVELDDVDLDLRMSRHAYAARLAVPRGSVGTGQVQLPLSRLRVAAAIDLDRKRLTVNHLEVAAGELALFARGDVESLCDPSLGLEGTLYLPLDLVSTILGPQAPAMSGTAAVNLKKVEGSPKDPNVELEVTLSRAQVAGFEIGDAFLEARLDRGAISVDKLDLAVGEGRAHVTGTVGLGKGLPVSAAVEFDNLGFGRLVDKLGLHHAWVDFAGNGHAEVKGQIVPFHLGGPASVDVRDFHVYSSGWDRPDHFHVLDLEQAHVELTTDFNPERARLYRAKVRTERGTDVDADVTLKFDEHLDIEATPHLIELADLKHIIGIPWEGRLVGGQVAIRGPFSEPRIDGQASLRDFRFQKVNAGSVETQVRMRDFVLSFLDVHALKGSSRFNLEGSFDLRGDMPIVDASGWFQDARLSDLVDAIGEEHWVFDPLRGHAEARLSGKGSIQGPIFKARAEVLAEVENFTYLDRKFGSGVLRFRAEDGERILLEPIHLEGPCGTVHFAGKVELDKEVDFRLVAPVLYPEELARPNGEFLGARGALSAKVRFFGPTDHVRAEGTVTVSELAAFGVGLGSGELALALDRTVLSLKGPVGTDLLLDARVVFEGDLPFAAGLSVATSELGHYLPSIAGLKGSLSGEVMTTGTLVHYDEARGDIWVPKVAASKGDWSLQSEGPLALSFHGPLMEIKSATITGTAGTRLTFTGALDQELDVEVAGAFDARLVELILPWMEQSAGRYELSAHVSGPPGRPEVMGNAQLEAGRFAFKGYPVSARDVKGRIEFSQNKLFLSEVQGTVNNNGQVHLRGDVEMKDFSPQRLDLQADLDEVPFRWPETVPTVFSGPLRLYGPLGNLELVGDVDLRSLRYGEEIDLDTFFKDAKRRKLEARSFEKREEWVRYNVRVHVPGVSAGGNARIDNNLLKLTFQGDLTVVGTNVHMGLQGALSTEEGGRGFFRGNEFVLTRGAVDFAARDRIAPVVDVHAQGQVRDYSVQMHAFGPVEDPEVVLTSEPPLDRSDVVALLLLGVTSRDQGTYTGAAGGGILGESLMSLTGLDKRLQNFVPKNNILRDVRVQLATEYSDVSGMVEPTAMIESKLVTDALRLRFSQPVISGKGRRAQLEYRFNERVSAQGQWDDESTGSSLGDLGADLKLRWDLE